MTLSTKRRLDQVLIERGLATSRQQAQALIMSGRVVVDGMPQAKAGSRVPADIAVSVTGAIHPFVGRGGVKLAGALDTFKVDVTGLKALDIGSSTGGFTDCLLQRGAARVLCVDVGHGQLDWKLRNDPRVTVFEGVNARYLPAGLTGDLMGAIDLAVVDVSFISLRMILPVIPPLLDARTGRIIALVKPQFEVGRGKVGKGGIVRSPQLRFEALSGIGSFAREEQLGVIGCARASIAGAEGNQEYFIHLSVEPGGLTQEELEQHVSELTREEEQGG